MSSFFHKISSYVISWRKSHRYSKAQFSKNAELDPRLLRDIEDQHFRSRFYSTAAIAEYIRHENITEQLTKHSVTNADQYLPIIDALDSLPPDKREALQKHYLQHLQMVHQQHKH